MCGTSSSADARYRVEGEKTENISDVSRSITTKASRKRFPAGLCPIFSANDRLRAQPVAPVKVILGVDMGAVAAGIGTQIAVFVVEELVDVDVFFLSAISVVSPLV